MNQAQSLFLQAKSNDELKKYKKVGRITVQPIKVGTKVDTIIDGIKETTNTAKPNDVLVTGASKEQYLLSKDKLKERYTFRRSTTSYDIYDPIGTVFALQYSGKAFTFKAPWGEEMICEDGDYICSPTLNDMKDVYRIEQKTFVKTYKHVDA